MIPNHYARKKRQLQALSRELSKRLSSGISGPSVDALAAKIKRLFHELKYKIQARDLRAALGAAAVFLGLAVPQSASAQSFAPAVRDTFGLVPTSYFAMPALGDLDGDGDYDMVVGEEYGRLLYFENIGNSQQPTFLPPQAGVHGLDSAYYIAAPALADLDGDGDLDLMVGEYYGALQYFENTGTATAPNFDTAQANPFGLQSAYYIAFPTFVDLDDDGDYDLMVGEQYYGLKFYENIGSASAPQFAAPQQNPFGIDTLNVPFSAPAFSDLDEDGDLDLLVGTVYGAMLYYENTGTATVPQFGNGLVMNPFGLSATNYLALPAFADLDNDGDDDLLVGEYYGHFKYFHNTSAFSVEENEVAFEVYPNPTTDRVTIDVADHRGITVFDLKGVPVLRAGAGTTTLQVGQLPAGTYQIVLTQSDGSVRSVPLQKL